MSALAPEVGPRCCVLCMAGQPHAVCVITCTCADHRHDAGGAS